MSYLAEGQCSDCGEFPDKLESLRIEGDGTLRLCKRCFSRARRETNWHAAHVEPAEQARTRRARKKAAPGSFTEDEWSALLAMHPGCAVAWLGDCEGPLHRGHITPLSRTELRPRNDIGNIMPICRRHNFAQRTKTLDEWLGYGAERRVREALGASNGS